MDKKQMQHLIIEALSKKLGDGFEITVRETLKTNIKKDALTILKNGDNITPNIYLETYYRDLENGTTPDSIADAILKDFPLPPKFSGRLDIIPYLDFNHARNSLFVDLVNVHLNAELLEEVPHTLFLDDFAVIIRCLVENTENRILSFIAHNIHLKLWDIDTETLMPLAVQNTRKLFGVVLTDMDELVRELEPDLEFLPEAGACPMWMLSNKMKTTGAAVALFDDILRDFASEHGSFYAIFSSVHEILLIPSENDDDLDSITRMNQDVNATQVSQEEILGTHAYYYKKGSGFVL